VKIGNGVFIVEEYGESRYVCSQILHYLETEILDV
jgi:hypothetical protein